MLRNRWPKWSGMGGRNQAEYPIYLPRGKRLKYDAIVLLDRLNNCPAEIIRKEMIEKQRLFTLSNYGFYLFLIKISIHFTRIREGVDRGYWHSV